MAIARRYRGKLIHQKEKIARKRKNYCDRAGLKIKRGQRNALWRARRAISKKSAVKKMNSGALKKTAQAISRFSRDRAISSPGTMIFLFPQKSQMDIKFIIQASKIIDFQKVLP